MRKDESEKLCTEKLTTYKIKFMRGKDKQKERHVVN